MKPLKRLGSKHKGLGSKAQEAVKGGSKSEIESSSKELTELEKETFSIKINDLEMKLQRKEELCKFMEDEKQYFETEYKNKKVLKKESMTILNKAYQDFNLELLLLEGELSGMENLTSTARSQKKTKNINATKRTEQLSKVEGKLERKLQEVERNVNDIPNLSKQYEKLQEEIMEKNENFKAHIANLNLDFTSFMEKLQNELKTIVEKIIEDNSLKLHLLPIPYQALFESGMLGCKWFLSVLETCESLLQQNREIIKNIEEIKISCENMHHTSQMAFYVIVLSNQAKELFVALNQDFDIIDEEQQLMFPDVLQELEEEMKYLLKLNNMNLQMENSISKLSNKTRKLEENIKQHENVDDQYDGKSHLLKVIMQAKDIIIQEL